jgi:protein-histidine N-methyltransferase
LDNIEKITLLRRDLFDARFQLISEPQYEDNEEITQNTTLTDEDKEAALAFLDAPSDLVPGVYEGGLKTWECSLDLVWSLDSLLSKTHEALGSHGKRILEVL